MDRSNSRWGRWRKVAQLFDCIANRSLRIIVSLQPAGLDVRAYVIRLGAHENFRDQMREVRCRSGHSQAQSTLLFGCERCLGSRQTFQDVSDKFFGFLIFCEEV